MSGRTTDRRTGGPLPEERAAKADEKNCQALDTETKL